MDFVFKITLMKLLSTDIVEIYHENCHNRGKKILISITLLLNLG